MKCWVFRAVLQHLSSLDMNISQFNVLTSIKICMFYHKVVCVWSLIPHLLAANHYVYYYTLASPIQYGPEPETTGEA